MLAQHRDECGEKGDQETRVHEPSGSDNLTRRISLSGWNSGDFVWDSGLVEGEEDRAQEGSRLIIRVGLEFRVDVDDEGGTDGREQTRLREQVR